MQMKIYNFADNRTRRFYGLSKSAAYQNLCRLFFDAFAADGIINYQISIINYWSGEQSFPNPQSN